MTIAFFLPLVTSLNHLDFSKVIERVLIVTLASSLSTCRCVPSGPMDLCMSNLITSFLNLLLLYRDFLIASEFLTGLKDLALLRENLTSKDRAGECILYPGLLHCLCYKVPCRIQQWNRIFPHLYFVAHCIPHQL